MSQLKLLVLAALVACDPSSSSQPPGSTTPDAPTSASDAPSDGITIVDDPCFPNRTAGHHQFTCNGLVFDVEVPAACVGGGCGAILDVHGLTMSGAMQDANTELRARGGAAGFIVVQPSAAPSPPQSSWSDTDADRVYDILARAIEVYAVDVDRVHMTGFSQGGFMTWQLLCKHAETFASVAPAAAASNCAGAGGLGPVQKACSFTGTEVPSREVPILYMHGRNEHNYIPYACAQPQVDAIVAAWGLSPDGVVAQSSTHTRTRWSDSSGTVVELLAHDYTSNEQVPFVSASELQGHCFPGSTDPGNQPGQLFSFKCEQPAAFTWGVEVVAFFLAHPRS